VLDAYLDEQFDHTYSMLVLKSAIAVNLLDIMWIVAFFSLSLKHDLELVSYFLAGGVPFCCGELPD
jgi:hypothetical protein